MESFNVGQLFPRVGLKTSGPMQNAPEVYYSHVLIALWEKGAQDHSRNTQLGSTEL